MKKGTSIVLIFCALYLLVIGILVGMMFRSCRQNAPPNTPETYFADDSKTAELFYMINNLRELENMNVLQWSIELAETAYARAREYKHVPGDMFYYINEHAETISETIFKVWVASESAKSTILNNKKRKVGIARYYDYEKETFVFVACFD